MDSETLLEEIDANEAPEEPRFTSRMKSALKEILLERLKSYSTTMADDQVALQDNNLTKRLFMAIEVRLGEKEIIAQCLDSLQRQLDDDNDEIGLQKIDELQNDEGIERQPGRAKRRKI